MKILVLSYLYFPDISAGAFRIKSLIDIKPKLKKKDKYSITLICSNKNKLVNNYKVKNNIEIIRIKVPDYGKGFISQSWSYLFYLIKTLIYVRKKNYDIVFATTSKLMTGFLGAIISKWKKIPLYIDIRDIFIDSISEIINKPTYYILFPFIKRMEIYSIRQAKKINIVSSGFEQYFKKHYKNLQFSNFTNGIDSEFQNNFKNYKFNKNKPSINILCAGNIGDGQGLEKIIPEFASELGNKVRIKIIGNGSKKQLLEKICKRNNCKNVKIINTINRKALINEYSNCDILFLHLNNHEAFKKVLPSKIFEYAATGKPILAGVDGYARRFLNKEVLNSYIFNPTDHKRAITLFKQIKLDFTNRKGFINKFKREKIMYKLLLDIISINNENK